MSAEVQPRPMPKPDARATMPFAKMDKPAAPHSCGGGCGQCQAACGLRDLVGPGGNFGAAMEKAAERLKAHTIELPDTTEGATPEQLALTSALQGRTLKEGTQSVVADGYRYFVHVDHDGAKTARRLGEVRAQKKRAERSVVSTGEQVDITQDTSPKQMEATDVEQPAEQKVEVLTPVIPLRRATVTPEVDAVEKPQTAVVEEIKVTVEAVTKAKSKEEAPAQPKQLVGERSVSSKIVPEKASLAETKNVVPTPTVSEQSQSRRTENASQPTRDAPLVKVSSQEPIGKAPAPEIQQVKTIPIVSEQATVPPVVTEPSAPQDPKKVNVDKVMDTSDSPSVVTPREDASESVQSKASSRPVESVRQPQQEMETVLIIQEPSEIRRKKASSVVVDSFRVPSGAKESKNTPVQPSEKKVTAGIEPASDTVPSVVHVLRPTHTDRSRVPRGEAVKVSRSRPIEQTVVVTDSPTKEHVSQVVPSRTEIIDSDQSKTNVGKKENTAIKKTREAFVPRDVAASTMQVVDFRKAPAEKTKKSQREMRTDIQKNKQHQTDVIKAGPSVREETTVNQKQPDQTLKKKQDVITKVSKTAKTTVSSAEKSKPSSQDRRKISDERVVKEPVVIKRTITQTETASSKKVVKTKDVVRILVDQSNKQAEQQLVRFATEKIVIPKRTKREQMKKAVTTERVIVARKLDAKTKVAIKEKRKRLDIKKVRGESVDRQPVAIQRSPRARVENVPAKRKKKSTETRVTTVKKDVKPLERSKKKKVLSEEVKVSSLTIEKRKTGTPKKKEQFQKQRKVRRTLRRSEVILPKISPTIEISETKNVKVGVSKDAVRSNMIGVEKKRRIGRAKEKVSVSTINRSSKKDIPLREQRSTKPKEEFIAVTKKEKFVVVPEIKPITFVMPEYVSIPRIAGVIKRIAQEQMKKDPELVPPVEIKVTNEMYEGLVRMFKEVRVKENSFANDTITVASSNESFEISLSLLLQLEGMLFDLRDQELLNQLHACWSQETDLETMVLCSCKDTSVIFELYPAACQCQATQQQRANDWFTTIVWLLVRSDIDKKIEGLTMERGVGIIHV